MHFLKNQQIKTLSLSEDLKEAAVTVIVEDVVSSSKDEKLKHLWEYEEILNILGKFWFGYISEIFVFNFLFISLRFW